MDRLSMVFHLVRTRRWRLVLIMFVEVMLLLLLIISLGAAGSPDGGKQNSVEPDAADVWILDKVWIDQKLQDAMGINSISVGRTFKAEWQGTTEAAGTMSGSMNFSLPEQITSNEETIFMIDGANASYNWEFIPKYRTGVASIEAEFYDFYRAFGRHDCEKKESNSLVGGNQGTATLQLESFGCSYDPADRLFSGYDALKFIFRFVISISYCDGWNCYESFDLVPIQLNYELQTEPTTTIMGKVSVPDHKYPLIGVPVAVVRDGKVLRQAVSQPPDGRYTISGVPITDSLTMSVTLKHAANYPATFRIDYRNDALQAYATHGPFVTTAKENPMLRDFKFTKGPNIKTNPQISVDHLDDLGAIYYHTHQAWQLSDQLKQPLDFKLPVDIIAYSTNSGVFWQGPFTNGTRSGADPFVNLAAASSSYKDRNRPDNREWHEFGHHLMADMYGNVQPSDSMGCPNPAAPGNNCNHMGYPNASTTDSWVEAFAEFYSMMVARDIDKDPRPELYTIVNLESETNEEVNYLAWTDEEFAVAGLLLDLVDAVDEGDLSPTISDEGYALDFGHFR